MDANRPRHGDGSRLLDIVVCERRRRTRIQLPTGRSVLIGRSSECDARLEDASISRRHAMLHLNSLEIEDAGSKNGSWLFSAAPGLTCDTVLEGVNGEGQRLYPETRYPIAPGDVLKLGSVVIGVERGVPAVHTEPIRDAEEVSSKDVVLVDDSMKQLHELARRAASANLPVLLLGETGVGKDVLAAQIHRWSPRASGPFVRINCGALSESLLESELFGHQRGAFTGASEAKAGLLELAHGGSAFLDEIGELPLQTQVKVLHAIENGEVTRVGATRPRRIDVRYISATNRDLPKEIRLGQFRKDLFFRINGVTIEIPPLRKRQQEIEPLARYFLRRFCALNGIAEPELSDGAVRHLQEYSWPGNVRELKTAMERVPILCGVAEILPRHLPTESELTAFVQREDERGALDAWPDEEVTTMRRRPVPGEVLPDEGRILEALRHCAGNQTRAARLLGISRRTLVNRLNEYQLPRPRKDKSGM